MNNPELEARRWRLFELALEAVDSGVQPFDRELLLITQRPDCGPSPGRPGPTVVQQTPEYMIALIETGRDPELGIRILERLLDYQCLDPDRHDYGNWLWMHGWEKATDTNAVGMILPALAHVLRHHRHLLDSALEERLLRALALAGQGLLGLRFSTAYTNMFSRRMLGLFIVAHFTGNNRLRELAYWDWIEWMQEITLHDFNEYLSPTYTGTNLAALEGLAQAPGTTPEFREQVGHVIKILWAQMLDWFHRPSGKLIGPFARCYDPRLLPDGPDVGVSQLLWREFGEGEEPQPSTLCVRWAASGWILPDDIRAYWTERRWPHRVEETAPFWPGDHRKCFQTETFALGAKLGGQRGFSSETPLFLAWMDVNPRRTLYLDDGGAGVTVHHAALEEHRVLGICSHYQPMPNDKSLALPIFWSLHPPRSLPPVVRNTFHLGVREMDAPLEGPIEPGQIVRWRAGPITCAWQWMAGTTNGLDARLCQKEGEWVIEVCTQTTHLPAGADSWFAYCLVVTPCNQGASLSPLSIDATASARSASAWVTLDGRTLDLTVALGKPWHHSSTGVLVNEETYFGLTPFVPGPLRPEDAQR